MRALLPLFLLSAAAVGVEIALTRFFAVASFSEYGYWVISIAMRLRRSGCDVAGAGGVFSARGDAAAALPLRDLVAGRGVDAGRQSFNSGLQNPRPLAS